jgi:predicted secreted hydrolase
MGLAAPLAGFASVEFPAVLPGKSFRFPRDHGAHPQFRTEWWYVTGWLAPSGAREQGRALGFQVTFFRVRPDFETGNPSAFAPRQLIVAHAALADPRHGRLRHDERAGRAALGLAGSREDTTAVWVDDWKLELHGDRYAARIAAREFALELELEAARAPFLQGEQGLSRKGPRPREASYYYSRPHLRVAGRVDGAPVEGLAWLDHEWSSQYLAPEAAGWDWAGINLDDGGALMAFRMRARAGGVYYAPPGVTFEPLRTWKSPRTGVEYPVEMRVNDLRLKPLMDDQELDARASTGTIYWEGAVRAYRGAAPVGHGYLELTGYWRPMRL